MIVLRAKVARSASSERKLCTGRPSTVRPVVCFLTTAGERCACATTLLRSASAASLSVSSNNIGARRWRMLLGAEWINPVLRGWVNYFAVGHSSECFSFIKDWVEKKVRRHLVHAQKRKGFDWERWNRRWLYDTLGLFNAYRVRRDGSKVAPAG